VGSAVNIPESIRAASEASPILQLMLMAFLKVFLLLVHVLVPLHISVIYEGPAIQKSLGGFFYVIPFLLLGLVYLSWRMRHKNIVFLFGLLFFLITVSPAIAIGKYGGVGVFIGDRYTYTPMLGLLIPLVIVLFRIKTSFKPLPLLLSGLLCGIYLVLTLPAIGVWKNSEMLWTNAIAKTKCASPAFNGRGVYYLDVLQEKDKALGDFNDAIICDSTNSRALYNRGLILMNKNKNEDALADYDRALRYNARYVEAYVNRGNILRDKGRNEEAMADYQTALQLSPEFSKGYFNRGSLLLNMKRYDEAIIDFSKAISIDPNYAKAYYNRGLCYFYMQDRARACQEFNTSLTLGFKTAAKTIQDHCK
jgi:Tfp pilus assembly protein PilF